MRCTHYGCVSIIEYVTSLLSISTDRNTVSITPTQSTSRNASSTLKSNFLPSERSRRYTPDIVNRRYHNIEDFAGSAKKDNYRAYYSSPASSPTRANLGISIPNEPLRSSHHQCTGKIKQQQLINISPVPSSTSTSWQDVKTVLGMYIMESYSSPF